MVKKDTVEGLLFDAVALIDGFLSGAVTQEEFVERATRFVSEPALDEVKVAREKRAK